MNFWVQYRKTVMSDFRCNLVIPGAAKSGTSSLHAFLNVHPEICMSSRKEPHFFSIDSHWEGGVASHNLLFKDCKQRAVVFGESSTTYFISDVAIGRIRESLNAPKVIIVLRDPVERTISHYRWMFALGLENRSILHAIEESGHGFNPNIAISSCYMSYLEFSMYTKWVPMWQDAVGFNNVLLINSSDLRFSPRKVIESCCSFLGVSDFSFEFPSNRNETKDVIAEYKLLPLGRCINKCIPDKIRPAVRAIIHPILLKLWKKFCATGNKIVAAQITQDEKNSLRKILKKECEYFDELFPEHENAFTEF